MPAKIAVVGSLNMDLVVRAPRIPQPGETIIGRDFHVIPGGKGANQAVAAARLGGQVSMVGRVGDDDFGAGLRHTLAEAGIDYRYVSLDPEAATGVALIEVDDQAQNSIVVASGANMRLTPAHVDRAETAIAQAKVLLLQLEVPLETVTRAAEIARGHNVTVILNPAPAQPLPTELLKLVDILIPNESETALLTGLPTRSQAELKAAALNLQAMGVNTVILTLGEKGVLLAQFGEAPSIHPAFEVTALDTTAAGDAFAGGLAAGLGEGMSLPEAIRWGNAAGALATTTLGAQPSLPARAQLEALLAQN